MMGGAAAAVPMMDDRWRGVAAMPMKEGRMWFLGGGLHMMERRYAPAEVLTEFPDVRITFRYRVRCG